MLDFKEADFKSTKLDAVIEGLHPDRFELLGRTFAFVFAFTLDKSQGKITADNSRVIELF